jgi:hypothetical protein
MMSFAPAHNIKHRRYDSCRHHGLSHACKPRAFLLLKSRRQLDLLNPGPHSWTDDDLAAGLSRPIRGGGASRWGLGGQASPSTGGKREIPLCMRQRYSDEHVRCEAASYSAYRRSSGGSRGCP